MKILFVAMVESIHTARWISQLAESGHEIHLFPSVRNLSPHPELRKLPITIHVPWWSVRKTSGPLLFLDRLIKRSARFSLKLLGRFEEEDRLARLIRRIGPDLIHTLETQRAGYLVLRIKRSGAVPHPFPAWLHTNWGSDIYLFGRLKAHSERVREVLANCQYYSCESIRDIGLAFEYGFEGKSFPPFPNTGGFNLALLAGLRSAKPSERRGIMVKGYQGWAGRALVALKALELVKDILPGYTIEIYGNPDGYDVAIAAELLAQSSGIEVRILPYISSHMEMLRHYAMARVYIGLSISDSISTSLLEAMATGAFPIQSNTSTADEWIEDGKQGFIVPAEEPVLIADLLRRALTDDRMVDAAALDNLRTISEHCEAGALREASLQIYSSIALEREGRNETA